SLLVLPSLHDALPIFLPDGLIHLIFAVIANNASIGRNRNYIQFVYFPELRRFCLRCTGHPRQLMVHPEVILKSNGGVCLSGIFRSEEHMSELQSRENL